MAPRTSERRRPGKRRSERARKQNQNRNKEIAKKPSPDPFIGTELIENDEGGQDCELHIYEMRRDTRDNEILLRVGERLEFEVEKDDSLRAALVLTRFYSSQKKLESTMLEIRSPYAAQALRNCIECYPGVNLSPKGQIFMLDQPRMLFHYRQELEYYARSSIDHRTKDHVRFCLRYMEKVLRREITAFKTTVEDATRNQGLQHKDLWMLFKPGALFYDNTGDHDWCVARLEHYSLQEGERGPISWSLVLRALNYDGVCFGSTAVETTIEHYGGVKSLVSLSKFPLEYHPNATQIREELLRRGKMFVSLSGTHHKKYQGQIKFVRRREASQSPKMGIQESHHIDGRIMVDCQSFCNIMGARASFMPSFRRFLPEEVGEMTEDDLLTCFLSLPAFCLATKRWGLVEVSKIEDFSFNKEAFTELAISPSQKDMIRALVAQHDLKNGIDDLIPGKGKGLSFLLHGPPGVGKTFTAECIAELTERPLYRMDSDQLLESEAEILGSFAIARHWGAVVLIDEADIFMQQRDLADVRRNSIVTSLLKHVEYFEGILFLTTNRLETIDSAFASRIHLSIF